MNTRPGSAVRSAWRTFTTGLTTRGRAFLSAGLFSAACAILLGYGPLLRVAILLTALPVAAAAITSASRYRIACRRSLVPARVPVGAPARVHLRLENAARLPSTPLLVEDKVPYTLGSRPRFILRRIEPGGTRRVAYRVRCDSRGRYPLGPLSLRSADPLGLFELNRSFSAQHTLTVSPKVEVLPGITLGTVWTGHGDGHAAHAAAAGEDDVGVREYRYGDELRRIHWRATAHHGEIMVRREEQTWHSRCTILLDNRVEAHRGTGPTSSLEWAVSAAASAALHLLHNGYTVHLATGAGGAPIPADSEDAILDSLAVLKPVHAAGLTVMQRGTDDGGDSLIIAVLGALGATDATDLARARPSTASAVAFLLDTDTWSGTAAGRVPYATVEGQRQAATVLEAAGWQVVVASSHDKFPELWRAASRQTGRRGTPLGDQVLEGSAAASAPANADPEKVGP
ncbi:MAG TPA: DUF58 domain-containing protein [Actinocrinis sp.]|nr:DUF58 domain-containing protein [Actinocrinis sp.]